MAANKPPIEVVNQLLVDLIARTQMRRNEERVDWEFVAVIFKDAVTNEDSRDRDIFTRYRDKLQFNNVSLKKAVMEWTGKGSVSQVLALPDIKGIKFDFKLYVSVLPELPGKNQVQSTEPAEGSEKSKGKNTTSRPLKEVNSQESDTAHDEKCTCSDDSKQSNSDVDRSPRNLAAEPGGHNENRPPEGSPSRNEAGPAERHSPEPEEVFDPLQKAADFLIALIKRTAESQNWPLVNWLDVQKRYRDLVSGISDNDLYNEYHNYLDLHRRHLDCQQLFTWTGECCLEQLVVNPKFDAIGLIRDGAPPADLFVMVDTPEFPRSKIADYTESSRRMDSAEGGAMASKVHPATPEQPNEMSLVERVRMIEFFTQQRQIEKQRKQWYNRPTQGRRWQGDFNGNRGRGRSTGNNNNRNGYYSRNNNVGPSQRFNNNAGFENRGNYDTNVRRGNDINANVLPHNNTNVNIASHQRDAPQRSRVLASPQYIPNGPISSTSSSDTEGASPEPEDGVYTDDEIAMEEAAQRAEAANKATDPSKEDDQDDRRSDAQGRLPSNNNPNPHAPFKELDTVYFSAEVDTRLPLYTRPAEARTPKSTPTNENETRLPLNNQPRETRATKSTPTNEKDTRLPLYTQPRETRTTKSTPTNEKDTRLPLYTQPIEARAGKSTPSSEKDTRRPLYTQTENRTAKSTPTNEVHSGDKTLESFGNRGSSGFYSVPLRSRTLNSTNTEVTTGKTDRQPTEILARANKKLDEIAYYSNPFRRDARLSYIPVGREPCSSTNPGEPQPSINYPLRDLTQLPMQDLINIRMCTPTPQELPDPTTIFGDVFSAPTDAPTDAVENVQEAENNFGVPVSNRRNQVLEECLCGVPENSDQRRQKQQTSDVHRADSDAFKPR